MADNNNFLGRLKRSGNLYKANAKRIAQESQHSYGTDQASSTSVVQQEIVEGSLNVVDPIDSGEETRSGDEQSQDEVASIDDVPDNVSSADSHGERTSKYGDMTMEECIRFLAVVKNLSHSIVNMILDILREKTEHQLPKDARTLMKTNRSVANIVAVEGGRYWYKGVLCCLTKRFSNGTLPATISLNFSIDGLPLHKSGPDTFWPILMNIHELPQEAPMTVAIFSGSTKPPTVEEFLRPLVQELNDLLDNGAIINESQHEIKVRAIIADAPARAFIKGVVNFNGKHGCLKCTAEGEYNQNSRTVIFVGVDKPIRTDICFRQRAYGQHHKEDSPLLDLKYLNIIEDVIVADRLHLIDLGIMRKLVKGWVLGQLGSPKWSAEKMSRVSQVLKQIRLPSEIHRKFRKVEHVKYWKGSEFASFLHYGGIVVLRDNISPAEYNHFLLLFCAVTLLSSRVYQSSWQFAGELLAKFVAQFEHVYGRQYMTSNVHNLQHVYDEVKKFGELGSFSSYPFENELQHLKKLLRSGWRNLEQVINRHFQALLRRNNETPRKTCIKTHKNGVIVHFSTFKLKQTKRDAWFLTKSNEVVQYCTASQRASTIVIEGKRLMDPTDAFDNPCDSTGLNVCLGLVTSLWGTNIHVDASEIKCKLAAIQVDEEGQHLFVPLVHTLVD